MNRNELITKIQNLINEAHLSSIPKIYYEDLFDEVEKLRQPINLADFLAWEEGVEYEYRNTPCKIENNKLFYKSNKCSSGWCNFFFYNDEIEELQQAKKSKEKKHKKMKLYRQNLKVTDKETGTKFIGEEISYIDFNNEEIGFYVGTPGYDDADGVLDLINCEIEILSDEELENERKMQIW